MLQIILAFLQNETNDDSWNQGEANAHHESKVNSIARLFSLFKDVEDWEGLGCDCKVEVRIIGRCFENGLVNKLRVQGQYILRSQI